MKKLNRDAILASRTRKLLTVDISEWGGEVFALPVSSGLMLEITGCSDVETQVKAFMKLIAETVCDESGLPYLTIEDVSLFPSDDVGQIGNKLLAASVRKLGSDEEVAKNS